MTEIIPDFSPFGVSGVVEGNTALHGFKIVAAATRGAGINKDAVLLNDGIPPHGTRDRRG